ncbi:hypothetical protein ACNTMW_17810 [Planosporangium sp. 12N6]|uniref:hypothetical protein n=1 Tax=Planosporangium spinosum TaxID=3402278 RepID=UPI003CE73977
MANAVRTRSAQSAEQVRVRARQNWKRLLILVVGLFVVANLARSVLPSLGVKNPLGTRPTAGPTTEATTQPPTADVNGVKVLGSGAPIVTVDPGVVRPDVPVTIVGSGFDPGAKIDVVLTTGSGKKAKTTPLATATGDRYGSFYTTIKFPSLGPSADTSSRDITAQQRGGKKVAKTQAQLAAGAAGVAKLSAVVGKPGDTVTLSVTGFSPGEDLNIYWGRISGTPNAVLHTDAHGAVTKVPIKVGLSAIGTTSLVIVGQKSGAAASLPFQVLKLYPSIALKPYAVRAMNPVGFTGKGFMPGERVLVRLNSAGGAPILAVPTDGAGTFRSGGFIVPYQLKGAQRLVFKGELSGATSVSSFTVLPYMPMVRTSTYGGSPGTIISFYASGFGANEAVHVYAAKGKGAKKELVGAFRVDATGSARAAGKYTIPGDAGDAVLFTLVGQRSGGSANITFKVDNSAGPVDVAPQPPYVLPPDLKY